MDITPRAWAGGRGLLQLRFRVFGRWVLHVDARELADRVSQVVGAEYLHALDAGRDPETGSAHATPKRLLASPPVGKSVRLVNTGWLRKNLTREAVRGTATKARTAITVKSATVRRAGTGTSSTRAAQAVTFAHGRAQRLTLRHVLDEEFKREDESYLGETGRIAALMQAATEQFAEDAVKDFGGKTEDRKWKGSRSRPLVRLAPPRSWYGKWA